MVGLYKDAGLDVYETVYYSDSEHVREVDQILRWYAVENPRVLDIGCSGGLHALEFARRRCSVVGVDIEPSAIERAKKRTRARVLDVCFDFAGAATHSMTAPSLYFRAIAQETN